MSDSLANVRAAVAAGFAALAHEPPPQVTVVPTMADTFLPLDTQAAIVAAAGPIPQPSAEGFSSMTIASGYKTTVRFAGPNGRNWTETYAVPAGSPYEAASKMAGLMPKRTPFLASLYFIDYIRASDVTGLRQSITLATTAPGLLDAGESLAQAGAAVDYQIFLSTGKSVIRTFRGVPASAVQVNPLRGDAVPPSVDPLVKAYIAALATATIGYFPITPVPKGRPVSQFSYNAIQSINGSPFPGFALITLQNPFTLSASGQVQISLADKKLYPGLNGIWTVDTPVGQTFYVPYQVANNSDLGVATGRVRMYQLQAIQPYGVNPEPRFYDNNFHKTKSFDSRGRAGKRATGIRTSK